VQTQHLYTSVPIETALVPIEATICIKREDKSVPIIEAASVQLKSGCDLIQLVGLTLAVL
jgi:hypothetical protein